MEAIDNELEDPFGITSKGYARGRGLGVTKKQQNVYMQNTILEKTIIELKRERDEDKVMYMENLANAEKKKRRRQCKIIATNGKNGKVVVSTNDETATRGSSWK